MKPPKPPEAPPKPVRLFIVGDIELLPGANPEVALREIEDVILEYSEHVSGVGGRGTLTGGQLSSEESLPDSGRVYIRVDANEDNFNSHQEMRDSLKEGVEALRQHAHVTHAISILPPPKKTEWTEEHL